MRARLLTHDTVLWSLTVPVQEAPSSPGDRISMASWAWETTANASSPHKPCSRCRASHLCRSLPAAPTASPSPCRAPCSAGDATILASWVSVITLVRRPEYPAHLSVYLCLSVSLPSQSLFVCLVLLISLPCRSFLFTSVSVPLCLSCPTVCLTCLSPCLSVCLSACLSGAPAQLFLPFSFLSSFLISAFLLYSQSRSRCP